MTRVALVLFEETSGRCSWKESRMTGVVIISSHVRLTGSELTCNIGCVSLKNTLGQDARKITEIKL